MPQSRDHSGSAKSVEELVQWLHQRQLVASPHLNDFTTDELVILGRELCKHPQGEPRRVDAPLSPSTPETIAALEELMETQRRSEGD